MEKDFAYSKIEKWVFRQAPLPIFSKREAARNGR